MKGIPLKDLNEAYVKVNSAIVMLDGADVDDEVLDTLYLAQGLLRELVDELGVEDEDLDFEEPRYIDHDTNDEMESD